MQDDVAALFAFDRWANGRVLDACRKLKPGQFGAEPGGVVGWASVRFTVTHIAWVTELHLRTLALQQRDPRASPPGPPTEAELSKIVEVDDVARLLERAYAHFAELKISPEWLREMLTIRAVGKTFSLPRWAMLRHVVMHSTYHRGQVASKLKRFGVEQEITDFFWWVAGEQKL